MITEEALAEKLVTARPFLDERQWRLLLGAEALAVGRGGIALVARLFGAARATVQTGVNEIRSEVQPDGRVRAAGAGRPSVEQTQPGITQALEDLVGPESRGDPMSPLRYTTKSAANLVKGLLAKGFRVSATTARGLLKQAGYRLQATFKTKEGAQHPDRDAQFRHINATAVEFLAAGDPVVSVDTKKKELVGEYANKGREWQLKGQPVKVNGHDFPAGVPKAIPYGVYDIGTDDGFVSVGVDHDTAAFAVNAAARRPCRPGRGPAASVAAWSWLVLRLTAAGRPRPSRNCARRRLSTRSRPGCATEHWWAAGEVTARRVLFQRPPVRTTHATFTARRSPVTTA